MPAQRRETDLVNIETAYALNLVLGVPLGARYATPAMVKARAAVTDAPRTLLLDGRELAALRALVRSREGVVAGLHDALIAIAARLAALPHESVTDKEVVRFGATRHDYVSLARYAWPDPSTPDGTPYRTRDGDVNPASYGDDFDAERLRRSVDRMVLLALAAYVSGDEAAGTAGAEAIRVWFVDPATRQTPHLRFAQRVPGRGTARGVGAVDARRYAHVCDAVALLDAAGALDAQVYDGFRRWVAEFVAWLDESEDARRGADASNNVALWSGLTRLACLRTLRRDDEADALLRDDLAPRIRDQVAPDGSLPAELARARPNDYAAFTLVALAQLASAAEAGDVTLADYSLEAGQAYEAAVRWFRDTLAVNELGHGALALQRFADERARAAQAYAAPGDGGAVSVVDAAVATITDARGDDHRGLVEGMALVQALSRAQLEAGERRIEAVERARREAAAKIEALERANDQATAKAAAASAALAASLDEARAKAEAAERRVASLESKLRSTTHTLSDLRTSNSWRLTAPLRRAGAWGRESLQRLSGTRPRSTAGKVQAPGPTERAVQHTAKRLTKARKDTRDLVTILNDHVVPHEPALVESYRASAIAAEPHTFALVRIIGNDLYPRHKAGQSRENVAFILEHEETFEGCQRAWLLNRIVDPDEERRIIDLLEAHDQTYRCIAFDPTEYASVGFDWDALPQAGYLATDDFAELEPLMQRRLVAALYRHKNRYVMHNNGARNAALEYGRSLATWVLPWDGNCYLRADAWDALRAAVTARPHLPYFVTPMQRIEDNAQLLAPDLNVAPVEEPQVVFRRDAAERFDEDFVYGRRPKVELLWRLGVPGPWDRWNDDPWDQPRSPPSSDAGAFGVAGWVARLASGAAHLERATMASFKDRGRVRQDAIIATIDRIDTLVHGVAPDASDLSYYERPALDAVRERLAKHTPAMAESTVASAVIAQADAALERGPYSVVDKTTLPPSGDPHDYWHPAPYWWPNPATTDGLPYVRRDGERVPGTRMDDPESDRYDRTRFQRLCDDATALALAHHLRGDDAYARHGALLFRTWFVDPATRMNPHLRFAQVRRGHDGDEGASFGIIEAKSLHHLLDAARLLVGAGALGTGDDGALRAWLGTYLTWLTTSPQGQQERAATNNHGTYYDLQVGAIVAYLGDEGALRDVMLRAEGRLVTQFDRDGEQPHERSRPISAHYYLYNLQGWLDLLTLGARHGFVPADLERPPYDRVLRAIERVFAHSGERWPHPQRDPVDWDRLAPLASAALRLGAGAALPTTFRDRTPDVWLAERAVFDPHDGVVPYWNLAWSIAPSKRGLDAASVVRAA